MEAFVLWRRAVRAERVGDGVLIFLDVHFFALKEGRAVHSLILGEADLFFPTDRKVLEGVA